MAEEEVGTGAGWLAGVLADELKAILALSKDA